MKYKQSLFSIITLFLYIVVLIGQPLTINVLATSNSAIEGLSLNEQNVCILGDSITYGWNNYTSEYFRADQIIGKGSATVSNKVSPLYWSKITTAWYNGSSTWTYEYALKDCQPDTIMLNLGMNDLGVPPETVVEHYKQLVEMVKSVVPGTRVVIVSVIPLPLNRRGYASINESNVEKLNLALKEWVNSDSTLQYVDVNSLMSNSQGYLNEDCSADGVHLNEKGYKLFWDVLNGANISAGGGINSQQQSNTNSSTNIINEGVVGTFEDDEEINISDIAFKLIPLDVSDTQRLLEIKQELLIEKEMQIVTIIIWFCYILGMLIILYSLLLGVVSFMDIAVDREVPLISILTFGNMRIIDKAVIKELSKEERKGYYTPLKFYLSILRGVILGASFLQANKIIDILLAIYVYIV